mmetsp:Transcript_25972/g.38420  ORF Transcript_25972/g.38420 Transcript_25972/m.38420 type:complete len:1061 (+) Transcript_25972:318-3500(+)
MSQVLPTLDGKQLSKPEVKILRSLTFDTILIPPPPSHPEAFSEEEDGSREKSNKEHVFADLPPQHMTTHTAGCGKVNRQCSTRKTCVSQQAFCGNSVSEDAKFLPSKPETHNVEEQDSFCTIVAIGEAPHESFCRRRRKKKTRTNNNMGVVKHSSNKRSNSHDSGDNGCGGKDQKDLARIKQNHEEESKNNNVSATNKHSRRKKHTMSSSPVALFQVSDVIIALTNSSFMAKCHDTLSASTMTATQHNPDNKTPWNSSNIDSPFQSQTSDPINNRNWDPLPKEEMSLAELSIQKDIMILASATSFEDAYSYATPLFCREEEVIRGEAVETSVENKTTLDMATSSLPTKSNTTNAQEETIILKNVTTLIEDEIVNNPNENYPKSKIQQSIVKDNACSDINVDTDGCPVVCMNEATVAATAEGNHATEETQLTITTSVVNFDDGVVFGEKEEDVLSSRSQEHKQKSSTISTYLDGVMVPIPTLEEDFQDEENGKVEESRKVDESRKVELFASALNIDQHKQKEEKLIGYDGPPEYASLSILTNLELYFRVFVFPATNNSPDRTGVYDEVDDYYRNYHVNGELLEDRQQWRNMKSLLSPRIHISHNLDRVQQMIQKSNFIHALDRPIDSLVDNIRGDRDDDDCDEFTETFLSLWKENVLPIGQGGLSRITPRRSPRRGFHGDAIKVTSNNNKDGKADYQLTNEAINIILCITNAAFYLIKEENICHHFGKELHPPPKLESAQGKCVMDEENQSDSRLPSSGRSLLFENGCWPVTSARHSLEHLHRVTIGFGFQRLILHFCVPQGVSIDHGTERITAACHDAKDNTGSLPSSSALSQLSPATKNFSYVILTCNKKRTISILKELQSNVKERKQLMINHSSHGDDNSNGYQNNSGHTKMIIDNDDKIVLDALHAAIAPTPLGVVLHYQVLKQQWKRGDRDAVQRLCVVTDTRVILLDEDYYYLVDDDDNNVDDDSSSRTPNRQNATAAIRSNKNKPNAKFRCIDSAALDQVVEVRAADRDPRCITLVIKAAGYLQRAHKWRLICGDGEGAEQLVEEVRRIKNENG